MTETTSRNALMVVVPDRVSQLIDKGEVVERYYNPGNLFSQVHLVLTNDDRPDPEAAQSMVGSADLHLHHLPAGRDLFLRSAGWRPRLLGAFGQQAVELARTIRPTMIRCHGAHLNAFAASCIKRQLGTPYVVSLHINPDEDVRGRGRPRRDRLLGRAVAAIERRALLEADMVMPVYRPIVPFLDRIGVQRYEVAYNVLNSRLVAKQTYELHRPARVISVGRQFEQKNPEHLIRAVATLPDVELLVVGDGPWHEHLVDVARSAGVTQRVRFERALPNALLCATLAEQDIFATHTEYWELSKSVLEPLLTGLPVVLNRRQGAPVPELEGGICIHVENTPDGYRTALAALLEDDTRREQLGRAAYERAQRSWSPTATEAKVVDIYRRVLAGSTS